MTAALSSSRYALATLLNVLALAAICGVLLMAFVWQLAFHELPCPLCLLQRAAFVLVGIAILLNVRFGSSPVHYALIILSSLGGAVASGRQVLLHIAPGDSGYGSPFLGLHFYTWAFVLFALLILWTAAMLLIDRMESVASPNHMMDKPGRTLGWLFLILVAVNFVSTLLECGFGPCADDPVSYLWLS